MQNTTTKIMKKACYWEKNVSLFKHGQAIVQLLLAIGVPFGILSIFLLANYFNHQDQGSLYGVILILVLFLLTFVWIGVVFRYQVAMKFSINPQGIIIEHTAKQQKKHHILNKITALAGVLSKNPTVSGAALLAASNQKQSLSWKRVTKIIPHKMRHVIEVKSKHEKLMMYTYHHNFKEIYDCLMHYDREYKNRKK